MIFREIYLIPAFIFVLSYIFIYAGLKNWSEKAYSIFIYSIYIGYFVQTILIFIWIDVHGFNGLMPVDYIFFFNAWLLMTAVFLFSFFLKAKYILVYITPIVILNLLISFAAPHLMIKSPFQNNLNMSILLVHIILILIGDSLFALAFVISLIYIFQERRIKLKKNLKLFDKKNTQFDKVFYRGKGYNLELLDDINYLCLKIGFPLITVGIATGMYLSSTILRSFINARPIEIVSLITWLIYAILLHERISKGVRGKRAAVFSIVGFLFVICSICFSVFLFPEFHGFG